MHVPFPSKISFPNAFGVFISAVVFSVGSEVSVVFQKDSSLSFLQEINAKTDNTNTIFFMRLVIICLKVSQLLWQNKSKLNWLQHV